MSTSIQNKLKQNILNAIHTDKRIVGCVDYGSASEGRGDEWSDLDFALFIRNADLSAFEQGWKPWAAQFGPLLLAYVGGVGHPWAVYDTGGLPLRVDFAFHAESTLGQVLGWPNSPVSTAAMICLDRTGGKLTALIGQMVGQSLAPTDLATTFEQVCGDFWYYLLRTHAKLMREQHWAARHDFNFIIMGNLLALLRIESGSLERWRGSSPAVDIEKVISKQRLAQLNQCIPGAAMRDLKPAMFQAASLGCEVCAELAQKHGWDWPASLAEKVSGVLE